MLTMQSHECHECSFSLSPCHIVHSSHCRYILPVLSHTYRNTYCFDVMPADQQSLRAQDSAIDYRLESNRLKTFRLWPERQTGLCGKRLASAGFYYTGRDTTVQCFECMGVIDEWTASDTPHDKHRQLYPDCPFLNGTSDSNVATLVHSRCTADNHNNSDDSGTDCGSSPLSTSPPMSSSLSGASSDDNSDDNRQHSDRSSGIDTTSVVNNREFRDSMKLERNRRNSFFVNGLCLWPVPGVSPEHLARDGFFYIHDDKVQCPFCTGSISNWRTGKVTC